MADRKRNLLAIKARRQAALSRPELRHDRGAVIITAASGLTSPAVKAVAEDLRVMIDEALARTRGGKWSGVVTEPVEHRLRALAAQAEALVQLINKEIDELYDERESERREPKFTQPERLVMAVLRARAADGEAAISERELAKLCGLSSEDVRRGLKRAHAKRSLFGAKPRPGQEGMLVYRVAREEARA